MDDVVLGLGKPKPFLVLAFQKPPELRQLLEQKGLATSGRPPSMGLEGLSGLGEVRFRL
jgi:hypothetical protein